MEALLPESTLSKTAFSDILLKKSFFKKKVCCYHWSFFLKNACSISVKFFYEKYNNGISSLQMDLIEPYAWALETDVSYSGDNL